MKNFLKIRNIIILLMIIVAIIIILFMIGGETTKSKSYQFLFKGEIVNYKEQQNGVKSGIITLEDKKDKTYKETYAYDINGKKTIYYFDRYNSKNYLTNLVDKGQNNNGVKEVNTTSIQIIDNSNSKNVEYQLDNETKNYSEVDINSIDKEVSWDAGQGYFISELEEQIRNADSYIKSFEFVEGKLLYVENFKIRDLDSFRTREPKNLKVYFENDKVKYIKYDNVNVLELSIENKNIPEEWTKVPDNYKKTENVF